VVNSWEWGLLNARCLNRPIKCCPKIRSLKFNDLRIRSDKFYDNLGILLPRLTCLHLSQGHFLTPKQIKNIATKCCNLAQLWLSGENCCGYKEDWENAYCTLFKQRWRTLTHLQFDASKLRDEAFKVLKYLCMYVYVYVRVCVYINICYIYIYMYVCMYACMCVYVMYVCTDRWMDKWIYSVRLTIQKFHLYQACLTCSSCTIIFGGNNYPLTSFFVLMMYNIQYLYTVLPHKSSPKIQHEIYA
jgi:hypothetical protein